MNNEAKVRRAAKADIIGTARVMSYEDLEKAREERTAKRAAKEAKEAKKAQKVTGDATGSRTKRRLTCKQNAVTDFQRPNINAWGNEGKYRRNKRWPQLRECSNSLQK